MGRRAHRSDPAQRRQVEAMAAYGIPETDISRVIGVDPKTLRKHYRDELDLGETKANAQVAGFLFNAAKNGNVTAQIFWLKTRAKLRESPVELKHSGAIAKNDLSDLPDQDLLDLIYTLGREVGLAPVKTIEASLTSVSEPERPGSSIGARELASAGLLSQRAFRDHGPGFVCTACGRRKRGPMLRCRDW